MRRSTILILGAAALAAAPAALAQVDCAIAGPDAVVGRIQTPANYAREGGIDAFSLAIDTCNVGSAMIPVSAGSAQHPILTFNLYRLRTVDGAMRMEQVGMSWCFHMFFPLQQSLCCTSCAAAPPGNLGARCSTGDSATYIGTQSVLGPRWQVNAASGAFPFPPASPAYSGTVARRLQAAVSDLDPGQSGGGSYFVETLVVDSADAAAGNSANNASFRPCSFVGTAQSEWGMSVSGTTQQGRPAIEAWRDADPGVVLVPVDVPGDGRFVVGGRATELGGGVWRYEYAVMNLSSDRSMGSFAVPAAPGVEVTGLGFHDVGYHSGDGPGNVDFSGADWEAVRDAAGASWATDPYEVNQSANALRWGTLYNFRFDAAQAPEEGSVTLGLFKPGTPVSVAAAGLPVPGGAGPACRGDWDGNGLLNSADFFAFVADFFAGKADFNADGSTTSQDFFDFLGAFFAGC